MFRVRERCVFRVRERRVFRVRERREVRMLRGMVATIQGKKKVEMVFPLFVALGDAMKALMTDDFF